MIDRSTDDKLYESIPKQNSTSKSKLETEQEDRREEEALDASSHGIVWKIRRKPRAADSDVSASAGAGAGGGGHGAGQPPGPSGSDSAASDSASFPTLRGPGLSGAQGLKEKREPHPRRRGS